MFDTAGLKYENFYKLVDKWDLVKHENKKYLHSMDENFYKFLIDVYNLKEAFSHSDNDKKWQKLLKKH